ncbi:PAS domain S-box protein [Microvirga sp. BT350]|uniref:Sensor protein FixL n=2 Tax=Microvirga alba TaxID=2791025 RepID=A0A931FM22_9HYPH|nr:PAS domain S-box protein [Microvirga alba]
MRGVISAETLGHLGIRHPGPSLSWREFLERYVHAEDRAQLAGYVDRSLHQHLPFELEFRITQADGVTRRIRCHGEPRNGGSGSPRVIATLLDVTQLRAAEEATRQKEARLRSILETAPEAIVTIDEHGRIESFSKSAEVLFGYMAQEVIGENIRILMPSPHREQHDNYISRYLMTHEPRIIGIGRLVAGQRRNGSTFPMELAVGEAIVGGQRIFTGFIRDMTSRQRIEQELRQAQKMEAIGQLTGGIAHDFNNLLTVVMGNLEMLEASARLKGKDRALLSETQDAAQQGAKLTQRLLAFGRRQPLNPTLVDVGQLVSDFTSLLRRTLGGSIEMRTTIRGDHYNAFIDEPQLQNALLNLALNARDAMPQGGILTIDVTRAEVDADYAQIYSEAKPGRFILLTVCDTGIGMTPEVQQKAFEPFFSTKPAGAGTGLGLSMIYGFVKQSGGQIQLYSEPSHGTTVRIFLPLVENGQATGTEHAKPKPQSFQSRGETILVVEDDARVRRVTVARLRALGYSVIETGDATEALHALGNGRSIDLLFTDIVMPGGMTGTELARRVRAEYPHIHILLTSGYAEPDLLEQEFTDGTAWLKKPYTAAELARELQDVFRTLRVDR